MMRDWLTTKRPGGYTLMEIMIVTGLIGMLAVLALPSIVRGRKLSQGRRAINDARILDNATDLWASEFSKRDGDAIDTWSRNGIVSYTKGRWTYSPSTGLQFNDVLGNPFDFGVVGSDPQVRVNFRTKTALRDVALDWGQY